MLEFIKQPWAWYIAGPIIGLTVPVLLIIGNRPFGVSSTLKHICAACFPARISFFNYNWRSEVWNLFLVAGMVIGGYIAVTFIADPEPFKLDVNVASTLATYGIHDLRSVIPAEIMSWSALGTIKGFILIVLGGFLVGFGTRYAGGCTSGHAIFGLSTFQLPSLIATCCFMIGGLLMTNIFMHFILSM